jgi:hypothetical protein
MVGRIVVLFALLMAAAAGLRLVRPRRRRLSVRDLAACHARTRRRRRVRPAPSPRAAAARRLPAGQPDLGRAAGVRRAAADAGAARLSITDAYFEAMSGFSASGATVLSGLDALPLSINVWRCFLNYVGGLGIVVLAVAILPMLGVGGTQLFRPRRPGR